MIWPMSQTIYALTSTKKEEAGPALTMLKTAARATGFIHESYSKSDPAKFTRSWFAWANTLFGEMMAHMVYNHPDWIA